VRVLIVTQYYWPESFRITDLALALRERGHEVTVLTGLPNYPTGRFAEGYGFGGPFLEMHEGISIRRVPMLPRRDGGAARLVGNYLSYALAAALRAMWARERWDVSFVFQVSPVTAGLPAVALRALRGLPAAIWVQDLWPESVFSTGLARSPWLYAMVRGFSGWMYRRFDSVLGSSEAYRRGLEALGVPSDRIGYLPQWAEDLYLSAPPPGPPAEWALGFPVLFAGNLGRVQALETVLEAAALLRGDPEIRWVFAGDGSMSDWLAGEVRRLDLTHRVHLLGRRPAADMPALFSQAGAMLVSLKADDLMALTVPGKVQSYLAAARPIIGSLDGEGARLIEESGAGWAARAGDGTALAVVVRRMKELAPSQREAMGRSGRAYYDRRFSKAVALDRLEAVLGRIAARGPRAQRRTT